MKYDHDIIVIGLGPAGMAVSIMGSEMGLSVCAIEKHKIGGECMNVGCVPSKSLLEIAKTRAAFNKLDKMELEEVVLPRVKKPFNKVRAYISEIGGGKTTKMFDKVHLILGEGAAEFVDDHTVMVGDKKVRAKNIFICTGTKPAAPPIEGINEIEYLTNDNMFNLDEVPESLTILGGGAIGCEMAQAFTRLGCKCTIVQMDSHLIPVGEKEAGELLQKELEKEGVVIHNSKKITKVAKEEGKIALYTEDGLKVLSEKILLAAGRKIDLTSLKLENAGVEYDKRGVKVDNYLRTNKKHIFAAGDCNGRVLLSHAAMHQGMIALMNAMMPFSLMMMNFTKFTVPWTVFTDPQVSHVGMTEKQLINKGIPYETITTRYSDYGAAVAEGYNIGYIKAYVSKTGKIYGVGIVGEGSGEMINEWALAIDNNIRIHKIMMTQHSFPTMGFMTKRIAEIFMMGKMKSPLVKKICQTIFRGF